MLQQGQILLQRKTALAKRDCGNLREITQRGQILCMKDKVFKNLLTNLFILKCNYLVAFLNYLVHILHG